ncbi:MAG TPA: alpha-D-ribose 1-methylphosphonate 5-triphosphate diphosphatase [Stellaceae bacterium]|nr:alpha-D-ribose 1-methylphosphonate 5-triphosphate diphosphatase [Stellaceae bacterium]
MAETILTNGRIICRDRVIEGGTVVLHDGLIVAIDDERSQHPAAIDLDGDHLLPGLIEIHTDNMEKHFVPRPGVFWPSALGAVLGHDLQMAGAGVTTVFDAISLGIYDDKKERREILDQAMLGLAAAKAQHLTRAEHFIHLRCEVSDPAMLSMFEPYADHPLVKLVSLMDHTPGQRQWWDVAKYVEYHRGENWSSEELERRLAVLRQQQSEHAEPSRRAVVETCQARGIPMASHDDANADHIEEAVASGIAISEFPLSLDVAAHARQRGMKTVMGAPNVVRGGSHSGNVSAIDCAGAGVLDGLSSDYVPAALLMAAYILAGRLGLALNDTVAMVSANIADMVGLIDRGRIASGLRADLVRVRPAESRPIEGRPPEICPVVRQVWCKGERVA